MADENQAANPEENAAQAAGDQGQASAEPQAVQGQEQPAAV